MLHYQTKGRNRIYGALGAKIGIPINSKYKKSDVEYQNSGYYDHEDYEYIMQEFLGFGKFSNRNVKEDLDLKYLICYLSN